LAETVAKSQATSQTAFVSPSSILEPNDDVTPVPQIENGPTPAGASDIDIPFATPSNTLITEINDAASLDPASNDQSQGSTDQEIPKLKASVDSDFSAALQMNGRDDPEAGVANTRIMFAVPPLRPTNVPPIVFAKIEIRPSPTRNARSTH
jgi:hypothetical protein